MQVRYKEKMTEFVSFLLLIEIFYFYNSYVTIGGFGVGYQYIGCLLLCTVAAFLFLLYPDLPYMYHSIKTAGVLVSSYIVAMFFTATIWIFNFTPIRQMISGFFEPGYMILCIVSAAMLASVLREKMVVYSFWALTAALAVMMFPKILKYGIAEFIRRLFIYVQSGGRLGMGVSLEDTSYSFSCVFFSLYFFFHRKEEASWRLVLRFMAIAVVLVDVFKRSALLALAVGFAASWVYSLLGKKSKKWFVNLIIVGFLLFAFLYIPLIRYGLFNEIVEALHINTSSRTRIYRYYEQYYEFTPTYLGRGMGWVRRLTSEAERFNVGLASVNVHCDYVRQYIELGFWGYLLWIVSVFPWLLKRLVKGISTIDDTVIIGVTVALASFRITENISYLYSAIFGMSIVIIQSVMNGWDKAALAEREDTAG